ncbi:MAG TPA: phosphoadenylyl-sulfate reductase [Cytophagales bacterium]|jgi:phosphoadenosine phosphosulfate reductase|nr:phosphoadenylyl-sulfate reductase [Cytophagales bacterium]
MEKNSVNKLKSELENLSASEGLLFISKLFGGQAKFSTSFGVEDQVITHLIASQSLGIEIFTLDTGRLFQETYDVFDLTKKRYKIPITTYFPDPKRVEKLVSEKGPNSFFESVENRKECCFIRKVEPLQRALKNTTVWITGLRSEQSENRNGLEIVEWNEQYQLIKYNPILNWSWDEVNRFVEQNKIPINTLHKKGFPSIGCAPCTRAIAAGENSRAGRWWWESSSKECGLHEHKAVVLN